MKDKITDIIRDYIPELEETAAQEMADKIVFVVAQEIATVLNKAFDSE